MPTPVPATVPEFKTALGKDLGGTVDDSELELALESATDAVEGWNDIGPIVVRAFTEQVTVANGIGILTKAPVVAVTSLTRDSDGAVFTAADLQVSKRSGIVRSGSLYLAAGRYTAVYTAGRDPVPAGLKNAVLIVGKHMWQTRRGPARQLRGENVENTAHWVGAGYLVPNQAAHLMKPYAKVNIG